MKKMGYSQLSNTIGHECVSNGYLRRSIGQESVTVILKHSHGHTEISNQHTQYEHIHNEIVMHLISYIIYSIKRSTCIIIICATAVFIDGYDMIVVAPINRLCIICPTN